MGASSTTRSVFRHTHSRSRNLLSLPLYPPSIAVAHRRPKSVANLLLPFGSALRSVFVLLFAASCFFALDVLHSTSVQSAWNVIVPLSGTVPQPAATLISGSSAAVFHHTENESRRYQPPLTDPLADAQPPNQLPDLQTPRLLPRSTPAPPETSETAEDFQHTDTQPSTHAEAQQPQSIAAPSESSETVQSPQNQHNISFIHADTGQAETGHNQSSPQPDFDHTESPDGQAPQPPTADAEQPAQQQQQNKQQYLASALENAAQAAVVRSESTRNAADLSTFDQTTALNYFHLHKTGGVSFKERMWEYFSLGNKLTADGNAVNILDTCHTSGPARPALGTEAEWSCDWRTIQQLSERERNKIDIILGHQYWEKGAEYWVPKRDLRYFTVMRHPLHRKISFFFHFFVRNAGKEEASVALHELIPFLLGKNMPDSPLVRDAGPNYYASRLCSDGFSGYSDYSFVVAKEKANEMVLNSIRRLRRKFVFIGLQTQEKASLCMLKKCVAAFSKARGIQNTSGLDVFDKARERMNSGSYALTAKKVWEQMTEEQRNEFKQVERVDLAIYKESVKMFHEMVRAFECRHLVQANDEDSIGM